MKNIFILMLSLSSAAFAASVTNFCPEAEIVKDHETVSDFLSTLESQCNALPTNTAVDELTLAAMKTLGASIADKIKKHPNIDKQFTIIQLPATYRKEIMEEMMEFSRLQNLLRYGVTIPREQKVTNMRQSFNELKKKVESYGGKKVTDAGEIEALKQLEKKYNTDAKEVMKLTKTGKATLDCYENISPSYQARLDTDKLPEPRFAELELLIGDRFKTGDASGTFGFSDSKTKPGKKTSNLIMDFRKTPEDTLLVMTHEMKHGCTGERLIDVQHKCKQNEEAYVMDGFSDFLNKFTPTLSAEDRARLPNFVGTNHFANLENTYVDMNSVDPGITPEQAALMNKGKPAAKPNPEADANKKALISLITKMTATPDDKKTFEAFLQKYAKEAPPLKATEEYEISLLEGIGFRTEINMFKELSEIDPVFCSGPRSGFNYSGKPAFSSADFYRTLDEGNTMDEVIKAYALRNNLIKPHILLEDFDLSRKRLGSTAAAGKDASGKLRYKKEFLEYLKANGYPDTDF